MHVVLLHGTWGQQSRWTFPDSALVEALEDNLPDGTTIERFEWERAGNWHRHRIAASRELAEVIDALPDDEVTIVAHSHGGNVARAAVYQMRSDKKTSVVAVGTPFLTVESTERRSYRSVNFVALFVVAEAAANWTNPSLGIGVDAIVGHVILGIGALVGAIALLWSGVSFVLAWPFRSSDPSQLADEIAPVISHEQIRIIAVTGDEAGLALGVGQSLTYIALRAQELTTRWMGQAAVFIAFLLFAAVLRSFLDIEEYLAAEFAPGVLVKWSEVGVTVLLRPVAVAFVGLFLIEAAGSMAAGCDGMRLPLGSISIALCPVGSHQIAMVLPHDDRTSASRHKLLMERPDVVALVVSAVVYRPDEGWALQSSS